MTREQNVNFSEHIYIYIYTFFFPVLTISRTKDNVHASVNRNGYRKGIAATQAELSM